MADTIGGITGVKFLGEAKRDIDWEAALDQELSTLTGAAESAQASTADRRKPSIQSLEDTADGEFQSVSLSQFKAQLAGSDGKNVALTVDICDETGRVILPAGSRVTADFLKDLRQRGLTKIRLRAPEQPTSDAFPEEQFDDPSDEDLHTPLSRELDERFAGELARPVDFHSVQKWRRPRIAVDDLKREAVGGLERHTATSAAVEEICASLKPGHRTSATDLQQSVGRFVDMAAVDFDLLPLIVAMQKSSDEYLFDHCVNVALLSMAMSSQLGLDRETTMQIGLGGMLHDIGMLRVPEGIRNAERALTQREWHEIRRHPLHTLDMMSGIRGIPLPVRFIAYQVHERNDGTGYPRGRVGRSIHEYAKIVGLADSFAAMTQARPHRKPMPPYQAIKNILQDGAADKFDRDMIRALLDTVSLFPIGSQVSLSDGTSARVLRANPDFHTRPVVEELASDGCPTGQIIDLASEPKLRVAQASS